MQGATVWFPSEFKANLERSGLDKQQCLPPGLQESAKIIQVVCIMKRTNDLFGVWGVFSHHSLTGFQQFENLMRL